MARLRYNNALGSLGGSLTSGATAITFGAAPPFATLVSPDYITLVLEPPTGSPSANLEVVYLTAYTAGATTGTISRGQEGTTAVAHSAGVTWECGPTALDYSHLRFSSTTQFTGLTGGTGTPGTGTETGSRTITAPSKGCKLYSMTVDQPCRVRAYATAAQATTDLARSQSIDPTGNHGCLLEVVMLAAGPLILSPTVGLTEQDTTPTNVFPCNVRCDNGSTLNVTLNGYIEEA